MHYETEPVFESNRPQLQRHYYKLKRNVASPNPEDSVLRIITMLFEALWIEYVQL